MKKLYTKLFVALLGMLGFTAYADAASGSCQVICDDYTLVSLEVSSDTGGRTVELTSNDQSVELNEGESTFIFNSVSRETPILSVTHNGNEVAGSGFGAVKTFIVFDVANGDRIEVKTKEDAKLYPVRFNFSDNNARAYIQTVAVDNSPVDNYAAGLELKQGTYVSIEVNQAVTGVTISVNGVTQAVHPLFGNVSFTVEGETTVDVTSESSNPPAETTFTIDVDKAANVKVGYTKMVQSPWGFPMPTEILFDLTDGENKVEMPDGVSTIFVKAVSSSFELSSVTVDGTPVANPEAIELKAGMVLAIVTKHVDPIGYCSLTCDDYHNITVAIRGDEGERPVQLEANETQIGYYTGDFALVINPANSDTPIVSVTNNGSPVAGSGWGVLSYVVEPIAGANVVVKTLATQYNVKLEFSDDVARSYVTNVSDGSADIDGYDSAEGFDVKEGTTLTITLNAAVANVTCFVNDVEQQPVSVPGFTFLSVEVTGNTVVKFVSQKAKTFTVDIDHVDYVTVGWPKPHNYIPGLTNKTPFEGLVDGENVIEIPSGCTSIYVEPKDDTYEILSVYVDGTLVMPTAYDAIPVEDGTVVIVKSQKMDTGIEGIAADGRGLITVVSLQGAVLVKDASKAAIRALAPGLYIINGKKTIIR